MKDEAVSKHIKELHRQGMADSIDIKLAQVLDTNTSEEYVKEYLTDVHQRYIYYKNNGI